MNRLNSERSLYLRQHADNPVDWLPWGDEAFQAAHVRGVPILLSVGYSSCHWCHVMAHECFENDEIAALMNELFVNVKVDREERPDVDALYMQATVALSGRGGWPMTVFLTPAGEPFYGGSYFPPTARGNLPAFPDLLRAISETYRREREKVNDQAEQLITRLRGSMPAAGGGELPDPEWLEDAYVGLARAFDPDQGGFSGAPKFPPPQVVDYLLRRAARRPDRHAREMATYTLARMAEGGIHDQLGGGFHRYSVDGAWRVPHFEKMLYDNALLAGSYTLAFRLTDERAYAHVADETLAYLLREMRVEGGGFAAAQDADSPGGEEGAYFTWTPEQISDALPEDQARAAGVRYRLTPPIDGATAGVLSVAASVETVSQRIGQAATPLLREARSALLEARREREAPTRDDTVIASWNALAIRAFAEAGVALERPDYVAVAGEVAELVLDRMIVDGRLRRTLREGVAEHLGQLDDYANLCAGLLALYQATFHSRWLVAARELADTMIDLFADPDGPGFYYTGSDGESLLVRTRSLEDQPMPSGNAQAALVLTQIAALTGEQALRERATGALSLVTEGAERHPAAFGSALSLAHQLSDGPTEIAIIGDRDDPRTAELIAAARRFGGLDAVIASCPPGDAAAAAAAPLLAGREPVDGAPTAFVCERFSCRRPVTDPQELATELGS